MRHPIVPMLTCIAMVAMVSALVFIRQVPTEMVYSVPQIEMGLMQYPRAWIGRTVLVRGHVQQVVASAPYVPGSRPIGQIDYLFPPPELDVRLLLASCTAYCKVDYSVRPHPEWMSLQPRAVRQQTDRMQSFMHELPLIGSLFPPAPGWQTASVFRVTILPPSPPNGICGMSDCPDALLRQVVR